MYAEYLPFTPEQIKRFVDTIAGGNYMDVAAAFAGISLIKVKSVLKIGAQTPKSPQAAFWRDVEEALAFAEIRDVQVVAEAAKSNWQAAAWRLERRFPQRWGRTDRVTATLTLETQKESPLPSIDLHRLTEEQLVKLNDLVSLAEQPQAIEGPEYFIDATYTDNGKTVTAEVGD
jgi:hypothetical protein